MPYSGVMEDVRLAIRGERPRRMPFFALSEEMDVRVAGEVYERFCTDSKVIEKVQSLAVDRFGYDWTWLQIDDCILFEILGVGVVGQGNILRATKDYLPATRATLNNLPRVNVKKDGRCPVLLDAIKRMKDRYGESLAVVGRTEAPFTAVALTIGMEPTSLMIYDDPDLLRDMVRYFIDVETEFGLAQFEAGADMIWYGDCWASGHLLSLSAYENEALPPMAEVVGHYKGHGLTILHSSEENPKYVDLMAGAGVDIVSVGPEADLAACHDTIGGRCALMGNVDPIGQLMKGTPESVSTQVEHILRNVSVRGGHLINSGEMVPRDAPEENMTAFGETVRNVWPKLVRQ